MCSHTVLHAEMAETLMLATASFFTLFQVALNLPNSLLNKFRKALSSK